MILTRKIYSDQWTIEVGTTVNHEDGDPLTGRVIGAESLLCAGETLSP